MRASKRQAWHCNTQSTAHILLHTVCASVSQSRLLVRASAQWMCAQAAANFARQEGSSSAQCSSAARLSLRAATNPPAALRPHKRRAPAHSPPAKPRFYNALLCIALHSPSSPPVASRSHAPSAGRGQPAPSSGPAL